MDHPSVAVLIVTHGHVRYIEEAIRSALSQSLAPHEVIVVDDGSVDGTADRAASIGDPRVVVLREERRGLERLAETYNVGLARCRSDVIAILEGDDRWPPGKLERQIPIFHDPGVVVSHGPYAVIGARGTLLHPRVEAPARLRPGTYDALPLHLLMSYIMSVTAVIRTSILRSCGGFRRLGNTLHWDYPTFLALAERGRFAYEPSVVGHWRKHGSSGTMLLTGNDLEGVDASLALALETRERHADRQHLPTPAQIKRAWMDAFGRQMWYVSRVMLLQRRYPEARRFAETGFRRSCSAAQRLRLAAAWLFSYLQVDLERVRRGAGRPSTFDELT